MNFHNKSIQTDYQLYCHIGKRIDPTFSPPDFIKQIDLHCPAHNDSKQSLSFTVENGKALIDCKSGCSKSAILSASGLTMPDLFLYDKGTDFSPKVKQSAVKPIESPEVLKGIDDSDTPKKQAKRQFWALLNLVGKDYCPINERYGFPVPVLELLVQYKILFTCYDQDGKQYWGVTDGSRHSACVVSMYGKPFKRNLDGSLASYPIGWDLVVKVVKCLHSNPNHLKQCLFLACEGVTDYLAGWCLADRFNMMLHFPMVHFPVVVPFGILGAGIKPAAEIVETLSGCNVRLAFDNDKAGEQGEATWTHALKEKCNLDAVDLHGRKDLRELWNMVKPGEHPTDETLKMVKGELIHA